MNEFVPLIFDLPMPRHLYHGFRTLIPVVQYGGVEVRSIDSVESRNLWHDLIVSDAYSSDGGKISDRKSMMSRDAVMDVMSAWS